MQRGIQEADANGHAFHSLVQALEVSLLHGQDLLQSGFTLCNSVGADHLAEGADTAFLEEHVLGTAQADAFCAQLTSLDGIGGL